MPKLNLTTLNNPHNSVILAKIFVELAVQFDNNQVGRLQLTTVSNVVARLQRTKRRHYYRKAKQEQQS